MLLQYIALLTSFAVEQDITEPLPTTSDIPSLEQQTPGLPHSTQSQATPEEIILRPNFYTTFNAEIGFLLPVAHTIQFSKSGTLFDYVKHGGQDNLFPFVRLSTDLTFFTRHHATLLYQPLQLDTQVVLADPLVVDNQTFTAGRAIDLRYGFSFWRGSYLYDLISCHCGHRLGIGASLQIRNANIDFTEPSSGFRRTNRDIGFVPLLKVLGKLVFHRQFWVAAEIDGIYAPIRYLNGSNTDVIGSLLDGTLRLGWQQPQGWSTFLAVRYIGGGAEGTSKNASPFGDQFTRNWLHFLTLSLGASI